MAAREKKCSFRIFWSVQGVVMLIFMPVWLFWGHFRTFFGVFWDFPVFFLGYVFLGHTSYNMANKMFFQDFLVVSGGYYAHFHAILALLGAFWDFFWRILGFSVFLK